MADPVQPTVTFDNYIIPETVQKSQTPRKAPSLINPSVVAVAVIGLLTFVLGVMATLKFTNAPDAPVAEVVPFREDPQVVEQTVTRLQPPDLLTPAPQQPEIGEALQAAVLKGLQPQRTVGKLTPEEKVQKSIEAQAIVNRNKMRMLREGVMAGIYSVKAEVSDGRNRLVLRTVNAPVTQEVVANLLKAAAERGEIEIPASLNTANGQLDMDTMLFNLIQTSLEQDGTVEGAEAAREMSRRAFAASEARTREVKGERVYLVQPGDSLAYISLQFYGKPNDYNRIFEANRDILRSPDLIQIGQRLKIPG